MRAGALAHSRETRDVIMVQGGSEAARIVVIGSGVVGAATGRGFRTAGHEVTFIDTSAARVRELRRTGLDAREELDLSGEREGFVLLTLPTPNVGAAYDLAAFGFAAELGMEMPLLQAVVDTDDRLEQLVAGARPADVPDVA